MTAVEVVELNKTLGRTRVLADVTFEVETGSFTTLLGPSGCGKSTTLKCLAGLETPDSGYIRISGREVAGPAKDVPTSDRELGMVFQSYALWPHMTAHENVAFGLQVRRTNSADTKKRVNEILEVVGLAEVAGRYPAELSGGQQQRVALARALVYQPKVVLLDEPLSNLDAKLREQMRKEIVHIHRELGTTMIYVTHDRLEALSMSDKICVMRNGAIVRSGSPGSVWRDPGSRYVAEFLGHGGVLSCQLEGDGGRSPHAVTVGASRVEVEHLPREGANTHRDERALLLDMSRVRLETAKKTGDGISTALNVLPANVLEVTVVGDEAEIRLAVTDEVVAKKLNASDVEWKPGEEVVLVFPKEAGRVL